MTQSPRLVKKPTAPQSQFSFQYQSQFHQSMMGPSHHPMTLNCQKVTPTPQGQSKNSRTLFITWVRGPTQQPIWPLTNTTRTLLKSAAAAVKLLRISLLTVPRPESWAPTVQTGAHWARAHDKEAHISDRRTDLLTCAVQPTKCPLHILRKVRVGSEVLGGFQTWSLFCAEVSHVLSCPNLI